jgi:hypothetical protein
MCIRDRSDGTVAFKKGMKNRTFVHIVPMVVETVAEVTQKTAPVKPAPVKATPVKAKPAPKTAAAKVATPPIIAPEATQEEE